MAAFDTPWFNSQERNFSNVLNKSKVAHIVLTAESEDFDDETIKQWTSEGFDVQYVPLLKGGNDFIRRVHTVGDNFGVSEQYAIVAFGDAASLILEAHTKPNNPRLVAIVAHYPSAIPAIGTKFPNSVQILVHLAGGEVDVRKTSEVLGIQGKRKSVRKRIDPGAGHGQTLELAYEAYTYSGVEPGFAEHDLDEYDAVADGVAFTRSISTVRKGFRIENKIEAVRDRQTQLVKSGKAEKAMDNVHEGAQVIFGPTLTGGIGTDDIDDFYTNFFTPLPVKSNGNIRLLSRTTGTDRVVDELFLSFKHSEAVPWLLPGVPPTNLQIEVVIVSIFHVRGSKMESEHIYWDQASVLVQAGLIDTKLIPGHMKKKGMPKLPVVGAEGARAILRGNSKKVNDLIPDW